MGCLSVVFGLVDVCRESVGRFRWKNGDVMVVFSEEWGRLVCV